MNKAKKIPASPQSFSPHEVRISGGFWKKKMDVNRRETLPIVFQRCEETGRIDALRQTWKPGQPNQPHIFWDSDRVEAHPAVRQNAGRIALRRGPVVYCIESVDNGADLNGIALLPDPAFEVAFGKGRILGGVPVIRAKAVRTKPQGRKDPLYGDFGAWPRTACTVTAIPYFLWANRKPGEMLVWIRQINS